MKFDKNITEEARDKSTNNCSRLTAGGNVTRVPWMLNKIVDVVLAYHPKAKDGKGEKREQEREKIEKEER